MPLECDVVGIMYFTNPVWSLASVIVGGESGVFSINDCTPESRAACNAIAPGYRVVGILKKKIVVLHDPPYSSSARHGSDRKVQWPYAAWGADAVIAGHDHLYERVQANGIPYFVNGAGGKDLYPFKPWAVKGSVVRYNQDYGAQLIDATPQCLNISFFSWADVLIDSVTVQR